LKPGYPLANVVMGRESGLAALMFVYKSARHTNILPSVLMKQNNVKLMCKFGDRAFDDG